MLEYTGIYWKFVGMKIAYTGIYWNFSFVLYWNLKNILENILEYTGISCKILLATMPQPPTS